MSDFDPEAWLSTIHALPPDARWRKSKAMAAAYAEVGIKVHPTKRGGVVYADKDQIGATALNHRAHEISCRAVGVEPLPFEDWAVLADMLRARREAKLAES